MRIRFRPRPVFDLRSEEQKESYERIWKAWKMRTVPWQRVASIDLASLVPGGKGRITVFTAKETHNVR